MVDEHDFDYILDEIVGGGGWWQWKKCLLLIPQYLTNGLPLLLHMFTAYTPKHRCYVEGCDHKKYTPEPFNNTFLKFTTPKDPGRGSFLSDEDVYDSCSVFQHSSPVESSLIAPGTSCTPDFFSHSATNCSSFVYENSEFSETLTTRLNLVCSSVSLRHLLGSVMMIGLTLGSFLGGPIGDRFGRKRAMFCGMFIVVPSVILGGFVSNYLGYIILRLLSCTCIVFSWIAGHNFQLEYFSKRYRVYGYVINMAIAHSTGFVLPAIIYFYRNWRWMHFSVGAVSSLAIFTYPVIPESIRWLSCNGRSNEAEKILMEVATTNGRLLTDEQRAEIRRILKNISDKSRFLNKNDNLNILNLFGNCILRRTLVLFSCWICAMVSLYALMLNVGALSGDIFINFAISISADIPAHLSVLFIVDKFGRRRSLFSALCGVGLSCLVMACISKENRTLVLVIYLTGKFFASLCASMVWLFTAELYPTNLRSQALGTCSSVARIFGTTSSFISELSRLWKPLPMVALGIPAILSACLSLSLPETRGRALPQTLEEALAIGVKKEEVVKLDLEKLSETTTVDHDDDSDSSWLDHDVIDTSESHFHSETERRRLLT